MIMARTPSARSIAFSVFLVVSLLAHRALGCDPPSTIKDATPEEIRTFFKGKKMKVLTFLGYSGAEYENRPAMLEHATRILDKFDPKTTIVNIGATAEELAPFTRQRSGKSS